MLRSFLLALTLVIAPVALAESTGPSPEVVI